MFVLATIADTVKVAPSKFGGEPLRIVTDEIEAKFADRVIPNVGLCICLHSYESIGDPYVYPSDGSAHYKMMVICRGWIENIADIPKRCSLLAQCVEGLSSDPMLSGTVTLRFMTDESDSLVRFRLLVFRPFVGEILSGKVSSCTKQGIKVSLGFFENASIPKDLLQSPSVFARGEWVWSYDPDANDEEGGGGEGEEEGMGKMGEREDGEGAEDGEDGEGDAAFTLAVHDQVRFRVRTLEFTQVTSTVTGSLQATTVSTARGGATRGGGANGAGGKELPRVREQGTSVDLTSGDEAPSAMTITGSMNEEGLGLVSWWE